VSGERISANARRSSDHGIIVPFGDMFGFPSEETVATNPSFWEFKKILISEVITDNIIYNSFFILIYFINQYSSSVILCFSINLFIIFQTPND
jgi:hypothetical protein